MVASVSAITLPKDLTKRKLKVGVAIDGSKVSEKALSLGGRLLHPDSHCAKAAFAALLYQIMKPGDKLHVVCITTEGGDYDNTALQPYREAMSAAKVEGTCFLSGIKGGEPIADGILAVASKLDVDILVMGIAGYGSAKLGSVSADCCLRARCTTLVIKDPYEVKDKRAIASYS